MRSDIVGHFRDVGVVESCIDLVEHEEGCWLVAAHIKQGQPKVWGENERKNPYLWIANNRAKAATVFSPPDNCSISRKRFIGGMA